MGNCQPMTKPLDSNDDQDGPLQTSLPRKHTNSANFQNVLNLNQSNTCSHQVMHSNGNSIKNNVSRKSNVHHLEDLIQDSDFPIINISTKQSSSQNSSHQHSVISHPTSDGQKSVKNIEKSKNSTLEKFDDLNSMTLSQITDENRTTSKRHSFFKMKLDQLAKLKQPTYSELSLSDDSESIVEYDANHKLCKTSKRMYEDGSFYEGEFDKTGNKHGKGFMSWKDGSQYKGTWKEDKADGQGQYIDSKGNECNGTWNNNMANGYCEYTNKELGYTYKGNFLDDEVTGMGVESWKNSTIYQGQFQNWQKHGEGIIKFIDQSSYEGNFRNNFIHGKGVFVTFDERIYQGRWKRNKLSGQGHLTNPEEETRQVFFTNPKEEKRIDQTNSAIQKVDSSWINDRLAILMKEQPCLPP